MNIPPGPFDLIMADPPWRFQTRSAKGITPKGAGGQYATMASADIAAMPIADVAAKDCVLWLWALGCMLPDAFALINAWGFTFKTGGHWAKTTATGKQAFGTGYVLRNAGEPFLIATRGKPKTSRSVRSVIIAPVRQHSRKPDRAYQEAEKLMPDARRLDLFSREARPGWTAFGDEADKFGGAA